MVSLGKSRKIWKKVWKQPFLGIDVIENEFCAGRNRIEAPCSYVPCPNESSDDVIGHKPDVPLAPDVPEIDPEEEIEDPYSNEKKEPDEEKEIPDTIRPSSNPVKLSSISPPITGPVSPTATTTTMKKARMLYNKRSWKLRSLSQRSLMN